MEVGTPRAQTEKQVRRDRRARSPRPDRFSTPIKSHPKQDTFLHDFCNQYFDFLVDQNTVLTTYQCFKSEFLNTKLEKQAKRFIEKTLLPKVIHQELCEVASSATKEVFNELEISMHPIQEEEELDFFLKEETLLIDAQLQLDSMLDRVVKNGTKQVARESKEEALAEAACNKIFELLLKSSL